MILISFGSNLNSKKFGRPENNCLQAIEVLKKVFFLKKVSKLYTSEPIPKSNQPWFVNGALEISTSRKPIDILEQLHEVENNFGRYRLKKNEPRIIDLDLLCYHNLISKRIGLKLPHPRLHKRRFVIQPICDIKPSWIHPVLKLTAKTLLKKTNNQKIFLKST